MSQIGPRETTTHAPAASAYWALTGALTGLGAVSLLTVGVFIVPVALVLIGAGLAARPLRNRSAIAAIAGLSAPPFYLAWLNRGGPGEVCSTDPAGGLDCSDAWSPWPFVVVGLVLLVTAAIAVRMVGRR